MSTKLKLFIDANVFIAGSASVTGGSAIILQTCQKNYFKAVTSELILDEAARNIKKKLKKEAHERFIKIIKTTKIEICAPAINIKHYQKIIDSKDAHVLDSAIESKNDYLITLDCQHFFTPEIQQAQLSIKIVTPKDFITSCFLPNFR